MSTTIADVARLLDMVGSRPIAFHVAYSRVTGSTVAGLMLSQAMYWSDRTDDPEGWFWKTRDQWEDETGLSRTEQERARKRLTSLGILEEKREGIPARMYYRVDKARLAAVLTGQHEPIELSDVMTTYRTTLTGLSRAGYMRAKRAGAEASPVDYAEVLERDGMVCGICGEPILYGPGSRGEALTFDHKTPLAEGGSHTADNLQPAHASCNYRKGRADLPDSSKPTSWLTASQLEGLQQANIHTESTAENTTETPPAPAGGVSAHQPAQGVDGGTPKAQHTAALLERFDRWYAEYPRKVGKGNARKAWLRIKPDEALTQQMIEAVKVHRETDQWRKDGGKFIPHPSTWLNQERWEDVVTPSQGGNTPNLPERIMKLKPAWFDLGNRPDWESLSPEQQDELRPFLQAVRRHNTTSRIV